MVIGQLSLGVGGHHHYHHHHNDIHARSHISHGEGTTPTVPQAAQESTTSVVPLTEAASDAAAIVSRALKVLSARNKLRLDHIQFNNYQLGNVSETRSSSDLDAAPLDYSPEAVQRAESQEIAAQAQMTRRSSRETAQSQYGYSIPAELREAARIMAEEEPPSPSTGNHSAVAAQMRAKYGLKTKDTLSPPQTLRAYDGLSTYVLDSNGSAYLGGHRSENEIEKRAVSSWWMATMTQRGESPYAPTGYKVTKVLDETVFI